MEFGVRTGNGGSMLEGYNMGLQRLEKPIDRTLGTSVRVLFTEQLKGALTTGGNPLGGPLSLGLTLLDKNPADRMIEGLSVANNNVERNVVAPLIDRLFK